MTTEQAPANQSDGGAPDIIYRLDDRPPFAEACLAALQHVLAVFVGIITPPLIISGALGLDLPDAS